jgi:peptidoglycan/LPS O-acetylase OafA/YrhL
VGSEARTLADGPTATAPVAPAHAVRPDEVLAPPALAPVATTRTWLPALQSLRGLAALWVVLYHLQVYLDFLFVPQLPIPGLRLGWLGVDLFFVLSAYLLGQPFMDRSPRTGPYLLDRFLRIAPAYYAAFLLTAAAYALFAPAAWIPGKDWWSLVFLQNFDFQTFIAINPAFWSLAVELQFYLLLPFLGRMFRSRHWAWSLAGLLFVSYLWRGLLYQYGAAHESQPAIQLEAFTLPGFLGHFALGLAAARIRVLDNPVGSGMRRVTVLGGAALVIVPTLLWIPAGSVDFSYLSLRGDLLVRPVAALGFALMVLATASGGWVAKALAWRPLDWLGRISYSLYLIHIPVQVLLFLVIDPRDNAWGWAALAVPLSVLAGWLLYVGVEAPAEAWRRRRKLRRRQGRASSASADA